MTARAPRLKDFPLSGPRVERLFRAGVGATWGGEYVHWDDVQGRNPPAGLPLHEWWLGMKLVRRAASRSDVVLVPDALRRLHELDRYRLPELPRRVAGEARLDEAVASARLAGAAISRADARALLRAGRKPRTPAEELVRDTWERLEAPAPPPGDDRRWQHPIVSGILAHLRTDDRRLGRIAFYGALRAAGYDDLRLASISTVLRTEPDAYDRAFDRVATDENDATYFVLHQLEVLHRAAADLRAAAERADTPLRHLPFNPRQLALLHHALTHPHTTYTIATHRAVHGIVYETARTDLQELAQHQLLRRQQIGRAYHYVPRADLQSRVRNLEGAAVSVGDDLGAGGHQR